MKRFIVKKEHLVEYIERKQAEKIFYDIMERLHKNVKYLNENISRQKANQSVIEDYKRKNLITPKVYEMLIKNKIINEKHEII
jgi:RNase H-fold protein (predicted Holliday junction resolvase)